MATTYRMRVVNQSRDFENFMIFQRDPDPGLADFTSLAWAVKGAHPGQQLVFEWSLGHSIMWSDTGTVGSSDLPVKFVISQEVACDPYDTDRSGVELTHSRGVPLLQQAKFTIGTPQVGSLYINELSTLPDEGCGMIALGIGGSPAYAAPAARNRLHVLTPQPNYWIVAGTFEAGVALDAEEITPYAEHVPYPGGVTDMSVAFTRDREFSVSETSR